VPHIAVWNDRDGVPLALVFAQECEAIEMLCGLWINPGEGLFLDVPADEPAQRLGLKPKRLAADSA
jgi:hypothetical protein